MARDLDPNADMAMIKQMLNGGNPQGGGGADANEDAGLFERAMNAKDMTPNTRHPDAKSDRRMVMHEIGSRMNVSKTDPSVHEWDTIMQGEPWGSVPTEVQMQRPSAAYPIRRGGGF